MEQKTNFNAYLEEQMKDPGKSRPKQVMVAEKKAVYGKSQKRH